MKQSLFDQVIDWDNSTLPAKDTLSVDYFTMEYYGAVSYTHLDVYKRQVNNNFNICCFMNKCIRSISRNSFSR